MLNVDLHCHSSVSDGVMTPSEVAARAKANGVDVWALTDHDEVGGIAEARAAARDLGLKYVTGVEISASWAGHTLHIVGLHVDETNDTLIQGLATTRTGRTRRAQDIAQELEKAGIPDAYNGALKFVGNPDLISRMHFARYISELGICANPAEVFKKYLTSGNPGYVPHRWARLADAVSWIHASGGISVMAHPGRYKLSETEFAVLFDEFKQLGGMAIEVTTGSHAADQYAQYAKVAQRYGFLASRGSDFHGPGESRVDLGNLPPLPIGVKPVWHDWAV
ncbi:MAG: 3',5'-nucleoside bisphosphate phosphatase [Burkholderiaceae bacterium]